MKSEKFTVYSQLLFEYSQHKSCFTGISIYTFGKFGKRKGALENFSQSFPNGEHNSAKDEPQLFSHGA